MSRARGGQRIEREALCLLGFLGLLGGCDPGLLVNNPGPVAVGSFTRVFFMDLCTKDGKERNLTLYRCSDETPVEVRSVTVGAPFALAGSDASGVNLKANAVGRSRLVADVLIKTGETRRVEASLEARVIDSVSVQPKCTFAVGSPLPIAVMTWLEVEHVARGGGAILGTAGLVPVQAEGLVLGGSSSGRTRFRGEVPGRARLTSPHDPSLALDIEVVDPTAVSIGWKPSEASIGTSYGATRLQPTVMANGRNLCGLPGGAWTGTVKTPGVCDIAHAVMPDTWPLPTEYAASATVIEGVNPELSVRGRSVGTCTVEVRDESARWVTDVRIQVQ